MRDIIEVVQVILFTIGGFIGYGLGGCDGFLYALVAMVVLDYVTGIMLAIIERKLSSEIGFKGIFKKVFIFFMVAIGHIIDSKIIGTGSGIRTAVIFFYASNEGISILENATKLGLPVPEKLKSILEQIGDESHGS